MILYYTFMNLISNQVESGTTGMIISIQPETSFLKNQVISFIFSCLSRILLSPLKVISVNILLQEWEKIVSLSNWPKSRVSIQKKWHWGNLVSSFLYLCQNWDSMSKMFDIETLNFCQSDNETIFPHSWRNMLTVIEKPRCTTSFLIVFLYI